VRRESRESARCARNNTHQPEEAHGGLVDKRLSGGFVDAMINHALEHLDEDPLTTDRTKQRVTETLQENEETMCYHRKMNVRYTGLQKESHSTYPEASLLSMSKSKPTASTPLKPSFLPRLAFLALKAGRADRKGGHECCGTSSKQ
jgi:hypothetical protein